MVEMMALAKLADNIIHALSEPYQIDGSQVVIGVSIGIALAPVDGNVSDTLIRNADLALYTAKGEGRGQFRFFAPPCTPRRRTAASSRSSCARRSARAASISPISRSSAQAAS